jgi:hypothetical protein
MSHQLRLQSTEENGQLQASLDTRKSTPPIKLPMWLPTQPVLIEPPCTLEEQARQNLTNQA